jgi:hypothetical protein
MRFEWDGQKDKLNTQKHGISFDEGVTIFYDTLSATFDDPDHSAAENRWITIGYSVRGRLLVVCHADRSEAARIISARKATKREIRNHEEETRSGK